MENVLYLVSGVIAYQVLARVYRRKRFTAVASMYRRRFRSFKIEYKREIVQRIRNERADDIKSQMKDVDQREKYSAFTVDALLDELKVAEAAHEDAGLFDEAKLASEFEAYLDSFWLAMKMSGDYDFEYSRSEFENLFSQRS